MIGTAVVAGMVAALVGALPLAADPSVPPPPGTVVIDEGFHDGSSCTPDNTTVTVTPDKTAFVIDFNAGGPDPTPPTDVRRGCTLDLYLRQRDYTFAIQKVEYEGFASLGTGATGRFRAGFNFRLAPTPSQPHHITHVVNGPFSDDWRAIDTIDAASLIFATCDPIRPLEVTNTVDTTPTGSNLMTLDRAVYHLAWRLCPKR